MKRLVVVISFLCAAFLVKSQISADFEADTLQFCPPYTVQFHDKSTGSGIISRKWIFSSTNVSLGNNKNPIASYVASGFYDVTLKIYTATDSSSVTKANYIHAFKNPKPNFTTSLPLNDCPSLKVSFTEQVILGDAPISNFTWTFGDNSSPSNIQNPTHTYTQSGLFNVGLAVTDTNGCMGAYDSIGLVEVFPSPDANFTTLAIPHHCLTPLTVNYINQSSGPSGTTYWWNLGNGSTSTVKDPTETYNNPGSFNVTLVATSPNGCTDTTFKSNFVSATSTLAQFSFPSDTVCLGEPFQFSNNSIGGSQVDWDFGDGNTSNTWEPAHAYNSVGTFNIQLIAYSTASCRDTITKSITVIELNPTFTANKTFSCEIPFKVTFTPDSITQKLNGNTYYWESGKIGQTSKQTSPTFNYTSFGTYSPKMVVESKYGCESEITLDSAIHIFEIIPNIGSLNNVGCAPLTVNLDDYSQPSDSVFYRYWDFGDTAFYGGPNQLKTFATPGIYKIFMTVGTRDSCEYITSINVKVGTKQNALFSIDTNLACASDSLLVTNLSTDTSLIDEYLWTFGDGQTSNIFQPKIAYRDTGLMDISLIVSYNGCQDTMIIQQARRVLGPVNDFNYTVDCKTPFDIQFQSNILGADSIFWDYGDTLNGDTNIANPIHTYIAASDYDVTLYTKNIQNGCDHEFVNAVKVRNLKADFTISDTVGCLPFQVRFDASPSRDERYGSYLWLIDTTKVFSSGKILNNTITIKGYYPVSLIVTDDNQCRDTAYYWFQAFDPEPNFTIDTIKGCAPFQPQLTDLTNSDTNIVSWSWDFGGGLNSPSQNPIGYFNPGASKWYDVQLTVKDTFGCENTISRKSYLQAIRPPFLLFADPFLCENEVNTFENVFHQQGNTYLWDFGNGDTSTANPASYAYPLGGKYDLFGMVTDSNVCVDSTRRLNYIDVQAKPNAQFSANPTDTSCYPVIVQFDDSTIHQNILSRTWDLGFGGTPVNTQTQSVFYNYTRPGKYDVSMIVETTYGCLDTILKQKYITVKGPFGKLNLLDDTVCTMQQVMFALDSSKGILETRWDFGDGLDTTIQGNHDTSSHRYKFPGRLVVRAFMIDTALKCPKYLEDTILIHHTEAAFSLDNNQGCVPFTINSINQSTGADLFWWYTQGVSTFANNLTNTFSIPGQENIKLLAIDSLTGCADSIESEITIFPLPEVRLSPEQHICLGDSILMTAIGGEKYQWIPTIGLSSSVEDTLMASPSQTTVYQVNVTDKRNCKNSGQTKLNVVQKPIFSIVDDTTIYRGQTANLWVNSNDSIVVIWSPSNGLFCPNCIETDAKPFQSATYKATIVDYLGCFVLDSLVKVELLDERYLFIPNAFSPNGDGVNDHFEMVIDGFKRLVNFQIFDRWGTKIFETNQIGNFWDGKVKGNVVDNSNVFNYQIILETYTGENVTKKGFVTVIR